MTPLRIPDPAAAVDVVVSALGGDETRAGGCGDLGDFAAYHAMARTVIAALAAGTAQPVPSPAVLAERLAALRGTSR